MNSPFEARFAALRERFRDEAEEARAAIPGLDREALERLAHRFSGTAGMFGFADLSEQARALEDALRDGAGDVTVEALKAALLAGLSEI